ncbi:hypothetical protein OAK85_01630 [Mariniblastus sp.]|nr:hypothetical protein [Mariniblastus sp.]MDC3256159.1 hypothetical protein [bacterium]
MKNPSQENLLGYVLGALDAQEQRDIQQTIDENPEIEEQLLKIKGDLLPLDCLDSSPPQPGLARRTLESVAIWQNSSPLASTSHSPNSLAESVLAAIDSAEASDEPDSKSSKPRLRVSISDRLLHPNTWSLPDVLVGTAFLAIFAGLLFPVISYTRFQSRIAVCDSNLQAFGNGIITYSGANEGRFVAIPRMNHLVSVGHIGPVLKDAGLLEDDSVLACPGIASSRPPVNIPTCEQIEAAQTLTELDYYLQNSLGHFGFSMGHQVNGTYQPPRVCGNSIRGVSYVIIAGDRPSANMPGRASMNHSSHGQNILFEDGSTRYVVGHSLGEDAIFENDYGIVGPGSHFGDNVIAAAHLRPASE